MPANSVAATLLPLSQIHPNPNQARKNFDPQELEALKASLQERGLINPISVIKQADAGYMIIAGERRYRAALALGWKEIDARGWPSSTTPQEIELLSMVENLQRTDLNPMEVANGYRILSEPPHNLKQEVLAKEVGKSQQTISSYIVLTKLDPKVQKITSRLVKLTLAHLLQICRLKTPEDQIALAQEASQKELSVKELKVLVDKRLKGGPSSGLRPPSPDPGEGQARPSPILGEGARMAGDGTSDPLASTWSHLKTHQGIGVSADWEATYGPKAGTWTFTAKPHGGSYANFLASWFSEMAEGLSPLETPKFTKVQFDAQARQVHLGWDFVSHALTYEIKYGFNYPQEPLKPLPTQGDILGCEFHLTIQGTDRAEVWLAIQAIASAGRASTVSEPVRVSLQLPSPPALTPTRPKSDPLLDGLDPETRALVETELKKGPLL